VKIKNAKNTFIKRLLPIVSTAVLIVGMTAGCKLDTKKANADNSNKQTESDTAGKQKDNQKDNQKEIMEQFQELLENASLIEIARFLDGNVSQVSSDNAVKMVDEFEKRQKEFLPELDRKFVENEDIQRKMAEVFLQGFDISKIDSIEDEKVQELLKETKESGYKVETAEGMFFPVINYEVYKKYSDYVTDDLREYIDIMAVESNNTPAKDAALVISWEEMLSRALKQEKFIAGYPDSIRIDDVKGLYKKYLTYTLFGLNNTPLFSYDSNTMNSEAKKAYLDVLASNSKDSGYLKILSGFMSLLEENGYKLTGEVEEYWDEVMEKLD